MITLKKAKVVQINRARPGYIEALVDIGGKHQKAICYEALTGEIKRGDVVIINTTAVDLGLGTGGWHFILFNLSKKEIVSQSDGHIMKLRYTPLQIKCLAVEEEKSPYHELLKDATDIAGMPVIVGSLHSQLPAAAIVLKELVPDASIAYIMTDGAALPIAFSEHVARMVEDGIINETVTVGHAFGGSIEAVNIFSGLAAAKHAAKADVAIVCMGPGIVGSNTRLGFTGIEQGQIINAVNGLKGRPVAIPRISFADTRLRHQGLSHHTLTSLSIAAVSRCTVTIPKMDKSKEDIVYGQIRDSGLDKIHDIVKIDAAITLEAIKKKGILPTTMGRTVDQDPEFFMAAGAAGIYTANMLLGSS
ncbi:MAG: DUF3866 family protein [Actinomycetota bacterium]